VSLVTSLQNRESPRIGAKVALAGPLASQTLTALSDEFSRRILVSTVSKGKTVQEISAEQAVPLSSCYRRAHDLVDRGLLVVEKIVVTAEGKRYAIFRSCFERVEIELNLSEISVSVKMNEDVADKFQQKLFRLSLGES
jgi:hypothetical protein